MKIYLQKYDTHIFDCDGVILDSNAIKGEVFYETAISFSTKKNAELLLNYHLHNGGINRREKFVHFFKNILGKNQFESELNDALLKFKQLNNQKIINSKIIEGFDFFLKLIPENAHKYVISAGDQDDLITVLKQKKLFNLFNGVFGAPSSKKDIINSLNLKNDSIFYGDSRLDYETAKYFNFDFVFLSGNCSWPSWEKELNDPNILISKNFSTMLSHIIN